MEQLSKLTNTEFTFEFAGKNYTVRTASLRKVVLYQQKIKELTDAKTVGADLILVAYCIWLVLKDAYPEVTEDYVMDNLQGSLEPLDIFQDLGFLSPSQMKLAKNLQPAKQTTESSSSL